MKQIKQLIALITLVAFACGLQGCASSRYTPSDVTYNQHSGMYNTHSRPDYSTRTTSASNIEESSFTTAHALGIGTGIVVGAAALFALFIVTIPFIVVAHGIPVG